MNKQVNSFILFESINQKFIIRRCLMKAIADKKYRKKRINAKFLSYNKILAIKFSKLTRLICIIKNFYVMLT